MRKWYPEDGGFQLHVASTASEWIMASVFNVFILTFVREFQKISMNHPEVSLRHLLLWKEWVEIHSDIFSDVFCYVTRLVSSL